MMHSDPWQQSVSHNANHQNALLQQAAQALHQLNLSQQGGGFGQGSFGQGAYGQGVYGQGGYGSGQFNANYGWAGAQRQLAPQDVGAILQQVAPILPQIIAQAQQQQYVPQAAFGGGFGAHQRSLSPQDVNEVVRQILPILPQLLQSAQSQSWQAGPFGFGQMGGGYGQPNMGWGQAAYGLAPQFNSLQHNPSRQLTPQDVAEIARQLAEMIPQGMGGQAFGQQRM